MSEQAAGEEPQKDAYLDTSQLSWLEAVGMTSGALLFVSLFLPWFSTGSNKDAGITTAGIGPNATADAFQVYRVIDWLLLALSFAPFILAWIIARRHVLSWPTGEVTMVTGLIGIFLVFSNGLLLGKPAPGIEVSLDIGWFLGLLGCIGIFFAGLMRQAEKTSTKGRKPPGAV